MTSEVVVPIENEQWYSQLIEDCKDIITEAVFTSRWALVEGYHQLGERIVTDSDYNKWEQNKAGLVLQGLAKDINISERSLYYAIQFYEKYPRLDAVAEGERQKLLAEKELRWMVWRYSEAKRNIELGLCEARE